jgi:small subunit ribosomal protein S3Ae
MAKATVDKWKSKKSFEITAPALFQERVIGHTIAYNAKELPGRVILASLSDMSGEFNPRQQRVKLRLKIDKVLGTTAKTIFLGSRLAQDYERSLVRRRTSKIYVSQDVVTKDNKKLRVKSILVTSRQVNSSRKGAIRLRYRDFLEAEAKTQSFNDFINNAVFGRLAPKTKKMMSTIYPLRHAVIQKTEVLGLAPIEPVAKKEEKPAEAVAEEKPEEAIAEAPKAEEAPAEEKAEPEAAEAPAEKEEKPEA